MWRMHARSSIAQRALVGADCKSEQAEPRNSKIIAENSEKKAWRILPPNLQLMLECF